MKNKLITNRIKQYKPAIRTLFNKIKEFDRIVVYRHHKPDYDAIGTQLGLVEFIKTNYPNKEVHYVGDDHVTLTGRCFPKMEVLEKDWFKKPFLAIIVDTSNLDRAGLPDDYESFKDASCFIKIDHHPDVEKFGDVSIVDPSFSAAGELMAAILIASGKEISVSCATNLYKAIAGDSGRFLYESVVESTFEIAKILVSKGINLTKIYSEMYNQKVSDLETTAWILRHYQITEHGVAYYVLDEEALTKLKLPPERGKDNVNLFAHFDGINAWMSVTQDVKKNEWRVSIRSAEKSIESIAIKYNGGGHAQASGCKIKTIDELPNLVKDLDNLFA